MRVILTAPVGATNSDCQKTPRETFVPRRWPLLLILLAGCSRPVAEPVPVPVIAPEPDLHFHTDLAAARRAAATTGKPLCVFLVLGDWNRHC